MAKYKNAVKEAKKKRNKPCNNTTLPCAASAEETKPTDISTEETSAGGQEHKNNRQERAASKYDARLAKSAGSSPRHIEARRRVAHTYLKENGYTDDQITDALGSPKGNRVGGFDLSKPVEVVSFPPPEYMTQYVKSHGYPGNWFDPKGNQSPGALGINGKTRTKARFKVTKGTGLKGTAGPIVDDWTVPKKPVQTPGGGQQVFVNDNIKNRIILKNKIGG